MKPIPFALSESIEPDLAALHAYWNSLKRGQAEMPFTDDVKLTAVPRPASTMLVDVLKRPTRFRFALVGEDIRATYGSDLAGLLADEIDIRGPLDFFLSQCSASVEGRGATHYAHDIYSRLVMPLWGDAHVNALLIGVSERR